MTTCAYCNARKGKRDCPALGAICSQCCGEHRVDDIPCPPGCVHLGVDAFRLPSSTPHVLDAETIAAAVDELSEFDVPAGWRKDLEAAFDLVGDPAELPAWASDVAARFLVIGYRRPDGERVVDAYLRKKGRDLPIAHARVIVALTRAVASLYKVTRVILPATVGVRNLLSQEAFDVRSDALAVSLRKGNVLYGWVLDCGDRREFEGLPLLIPPSSVAIVSRDFRTALAWAKTQWPALGDAELGGTAAYAVLDRLLDEIQWQKKPRLTNTHGEDLVVAIARYRIAGTVAALRQAFSGRDDLDESRYGFDWITPTGKTIQGSPEVLSLGALVIRDGTLRLEVNSQERLARGKELVRSLAGSLLEHLGDSVEPFDAARLSRERPFLESSVEAADGIPEDVQRQVVKEHLSQHYAEWPDVALPALSGLTPRAAMKTKVGRAKVEALLEEIESGTRRMPGGEDVDFAAVRRKLGL